MNAATSSFLPSEARIARRTTSLSLLLFSTFAIPLIASLFFKENWLWMDEVLSTLLINDPSFSHMNAAVVSGMDANPPLFPNLYWILGHTFSSNIYFLRGISIVIFASTLAFFYRYLSRLIDAPATNLVLVMIVASTTYLNFTLATQLRSYSAFFAIGLLYFISVHRLLVSPRDNLALLAHFCAGALLIFIHNFGLFYLTAAGALFALFTIATRGRFSLKPILSLALVFGLWTLLWLPNFLIQSRAGEPHSWIALPTWHSFFATTGELAPSLSSRLERVGPFTFFPVIRFVLVAALFLYFAPIKLRRGAETVLRDPAFLFYLLSGWIYFVTLAIAIVVSFAHTSVFISRYLWPSQLLVMYQLIYAFHQIKRPRRPWPKWAPVATAAFVAAFIFFQNRKIVVFPRAIVPSLYALPHPYPVFVETADYYLPLWFHHLGVPVHYVLDWGSAVSPLNPPSATVENQILAGVHENYSLPGIERRVDFNAANFPHFYVVDELGVFQFEKFIADGLVRVVAEIPVNVPAHRILECEFVPKRRS